MKDPKIQAENLLDKWINGQRKYVLNELSSMSGMRAACVSAEISRQLTAYQREGTADTFIEIMRERLT